MAAHKFYDRVQETTTTTGTGNITLGGAVTGFREFSSVLSDGDTFPYAIAHQSADEWEVGYGTASGSANTVVRSTILSSSNGGSAVNFSSGTKNIWLDVPAGFFQSLAAKGSILTHDGTKYAGLAVGSDGYVLAADSSAANGIAWWRGSRYYAVTTNNCSNTASEIDVISATIPANTWLDGEKHIIEAPVEWRNLDGGSPTLTIKFYYGSSSYTVQSQTISGTGLTRLRYGIEAWRVGSDIWVLGWDYAYGYAVPYHFAALNAAIGADTFASGKNGSILSAPGFTTDKTLKITAQWSAASANRYYTVKAGKIWKI